MEDLNGIIKIKDHTLQKHRILEKYLNACITFQKKYENFAYIETHGGSGKVLFEGKEIDGSVLIAAVTGYPCHVSEIDPQRCRQLEQFTKRCNNVKIFSGDCNELIKDMLAPLDDWKFKLCFLDPDGLVYDPLSIDQLRWETIETIGQCPKTEILLNFPLQAIGRCGGHKKGEEKSTASAKLVERVSKFFGNSEWKNQELNGTSLIKFLFSRLSNYYKYRGAFLVRAHNFQRTQVYYLVHTTNNKTGIKIMKNIFMKEGDFGKRKFPDNDFIIDPPPPKQLSLDRFF